MIEPREAAVLRKRRNLEIDRPVALVGVPVLLERPHELRHRVEVLLVGRARPLFDVFETERARIFEERVDPLIRVLAQRHPRLLRSGDRPIVDVGEVHDVADLVVLEMAKRPAQHVDGDERPEVADMAAAVDREPAGVHADEIVLRRRELFFGRESACCSKRAFHKSHAIEQILRARVRSASICAFSASTPSNFFSSRSRCTNPSRSFAPYRSLSKSSTWVSMTFSSPPSNVGRVPMFVIDGYARPSMVAVVA